MPDVLPAQSGILDPSNPLAFAFGGGNNAGLSYPELQRRRAIAQALASQKRGFPKNIGEGLTSLGEAVGDRMTDARLAAAERGYVGDRATHPLFQQPGAPAPAAAAAPPGPQAGAVDPILQRSNIAALIAQGGPGVPQPHPTPAEGAIPPTMTATSAPPTPTAGGPPSDDDGMWGARSAAIGGIETGGEKDPYATVGKAQTKYGRALGKYGVMTVNVAPWTQAATGQALTPEQFLANPQAQDAVFRHRFGQYVARFGEEGAARAWFGGAGNVNKPHLTDAYEKLSIGDYGKDYLKRLQGATSTSGASGDAGDPGGTMTDEGDNPPTPTTIRPIPGPADLPPATPRLTPEQLQRQPGFDIPSSPPQAPRKQETLTPEESRGWQILNHPRFAGDPQATEIAKNLIKFGSDRREADYNRQVEEYKLKYGTHEKEAIRRAEAESPLKQAELRTKLGEEEKRQRLGGIPDEEWQKGLAESRKNVEGVPASAMALKAAREDLIQGKMFTGTDAEFQLAKAKAKAALGWDPDPRIRATEAFKAEVAPIVAAMRSALVGNQNISDADRKAAERAAAGDITLDAESIKRVFNLVERINTEKVIAHNRQLRTYAGNDEAAQRGTYGRYGIDMTKVVPGWAVDRLQENKDNPRAHKDFDEKYHWPGLSKIILDSREE
jgi:hypothetical protein